MQTCKIVEVFSLPLYPFILLSYSFMIAWCTLLFVLNIVCQIRALETEWINLFLLLFLVSFHLPLLSVSDLIAVNRGFCFSPLLPAGVLSSVSGTDGKFRGLLKSVSHLQLVPLRTHIPLFLLNLPHFSRLIFVLITRVISRFVLHTENHFPFHPLQRKQTHFSQISQVSTSLCKSHNAPQSLHCFNPNRKVYMKTACLFHWIFLKSSIMLFYILSPNLNLHLFFFFSPAGW